MRFDNFSLNESHNILKFLIQETGNPGSNGSGL